MSRNGSPFQSVCDTATAADSTTSPILVDLDSPPTPPLQPHDTTAVGPVAPHQENENNAVMVVDGSDGPDVKLLKGISKKKSSALMSRLLDRVPLADLHYLSRGDLEQVESYILGLGQGAGLPVDEIDRAAHRLLTASRNLIRGLSQVHKDIVTVMGTAKDAVHNAVIDYILRHAADEGTQIYELEPLFGLPRHHKVSSGQQRILLAFIEKRWIYSFGENPPSWHARGPTASRHGTQNAQPHNSTKLDTRNRTHYRVEFLISLAFIRFMAYGVITGAMIAIVKELPQPTSIQTYIVTAILRRHVDFGLAHLSVQLRFLESNHGVSVTVDVVSTLALVFLVYMISRKARMAARMGDGRA
ncbi:hypothetical protein BJ322DRAFT_1104643 [Thelephora terrestris]|uniref:Uncharacterized protein n=1 Tax=Thelephora terrestris TaxID=56493 RepID=A0A9P6LBR6_9AGAM|nr:hypothetical protein BJ322DRAFT_1104643 [Thelephora terrestris]